MVRQRKLVIGSTVVGALCLLVSVLYILLDSFMPIITNVHILTVVHSVLVVMCIVFLVGLWMEEPGMVLTFMITSILAMLSNAGGFLADRGIKMVMNGLAILVYGIGLVVSIFYYRGWKSRAKASVN